MLDTLLPVVGTGEEGGQTRVVPAATPSGIRLLPAETALLLVDVIDAMDDPGEEATWTEAWVMAQQVARFRGRTQRAGVPCIYVADPPDRGPGFSGQVQECLRVSVRGRAIAALLRPSDADFFVRKPSHPTAFLGRLDRLLGSFRTSTVVVAGMATSVCTLFAAQDVYWGQYRIVAPHDCLYARTEADKQSALGQLRGLVDADTRASESLWLSEPESIAPAVYTQAVE
jgi:nicotinamidase-related amidase